MVPRETHVTPNARSTKLYVLGLSYDPGPPVGGCGVEVHEITFARTASDAALIAGSTARLARSERAECLSEWALCSSK